MLHQNFYSMNTKRIYSIAIFLMAMLGLLNAQTVDIPDPNFKAVLLADSAINLNGDEHIQVTEAEAYSGIINCAGLEIADLKGLEAFVNITGLYCENNKLANLDVSQNLNLNYLNV